MYAQFSIKQATSNSLLNTTGSLELKGIPIHLTQQIQSITTMLTCITAKNKTNLSKTEKFPSGFCNVNISSCSNSDDTHWCVCSGGRRANKRN